MKLFWIPIVKTPRKTKILHFVKTQNNIQGYMIVWSFLVSNLLLIVRLASANLFPWTP